MKEGEFYKRIRELIGTGSIIYNEDVIFRDWLNDFKNEYKRIKKKEYKTGSIFMNGSIKSLDYEDLIEKWFGRLT